MPGACAGLRGERISGHQAGLQSLGPLTEMLLAGGNKNLPLPVIHK